MKRGGVQAIPAVLIAGGDVSIVLEEETGDFLSSPATAEVQGGSTLLVHQVDSCTCVHKELHDIQVAVEARPKQRSPILVVAAGAPVSMWDQHKNGFRDNSKDKPGRARWERVRGWETGQTGRGEGKRSRVSK